MTIMTSRRIAAIALLLLGSAPALAQNADEIVQKHLAASGGRAALAALTSRTSTGSLTLTTPFGELGGTIAVYAKKPNKQRTLVKIDLSAAGGGEVVSDQRFDGETGYVIDTFNGNREITGTQLEAMRNGRFPTPLLDYAEHGLTITLAGQEKVGTADAHILQLTPTVGPATRVFIDAETFMLVKTVTKVEAPQFGGEIEQVLEFSDFREVDGIKVPYMIRSTNPAQTIVATLTDVTHNMEIDDSSFVRPEGQ
jgi:outer membrane lipoprotein-sorting protein